MRHLTKRVHPSTSSRPKVMQKTRMSEPALETITANTAEEKIPAEVATAKKLMTDER